MEKLSVKGQLFPFLVTRFSRFSNKITAGVCCFVPSKFHMLCIDNY